MTKKVIDFVRKQRFKRVYASAEWFGDPWYGTRKTLQIQVAVKKKKAAVTAPVVTAPVVTKPVVTAPPINTVPVTSYPSTGGKPTYPTYPSYPTTTTTTGYPSAPTGTLPSYPSTGGQPTYPTAPTTNLPTYPSTNTYPTTTTTTGYPSAPTGTLPSYPSTGGQPTYPSAPTTNLPTYPSTNSYPTHTTTTFGGYPGTHHQPQVVTVGGTHQPQVVTVVGGHQQVSWQYEDPTTHRWINYTPQESHQLDAALSKGMTKVTLNNTYGSFEVSMGCKGEQINVKTNGKRAMRFLVRPNDSQGVGIWQFEDGKPGSGQWKNYIRTDATKLSAARSQGLHTCRLTNKWGTYAVTMSFVGTQRNMRSNASRRVRFNDGSSSTSSWNNSSGGANIVSGTTVTLSSSGKWQFEDGNAGSGNWRDMLPQDQLSLDRAVSQGQTSTMVTNRFGTYQIQFMNPPTRAVQKNVRTNGTRNIRYTGQISAMPAAHHSTMGAHLWSSAMAM